MLEAFWDNSSFSSIKSLLSYPCKLCWRVIRTWKQAAEGPSLLFKGSFISYSMPSYGIKEALSKVNPGLVLLRVALRITVKIVAARPLHMTNRSKQKSNTMKGKREYDKIC